VARLGRPDDSVPRVAELRGFAGDTTTGLSTVGFCGDELCAKARSGVPVASRMKPKNAQTRDGAWSPVLLRSDTLVPDGEQ
jgi:hypothetical protein